MILQLGSSLETWSFEGLRSWEHSLDDPEALDAKVLLWRVAGFRVWGLVSRAAPIALRMNHQRLRSFRSPLV